MEIFWLTVNKKSGTGGDGGGLAALYLIGSDAVRRSTTWAEEGCEPNATRMMALLFVDSSLPYFARRRQLASRLMAPMLRRTKVEGSGTGENAKPVGLFNPLAKVD